MIRRILNAYSIEWTKQSRQMFTFVGPAFVVLLVLLTPLQYPLPHDAANDYGFIAYALPMSLNFFGFLMLLVYSASLVATELSTGTIRTLLVRPLRRSEFLAAKMLIGMTYALMLSFAASATVWALAFFLGDLNGIEYGGELIYSNEEMLQTFLIAMLLNLLTQFAGVAWGLLFSTLTRSAATAIGLAVGSWLLLDFLKHPLNIAPFLFSSYLEQTWTVFADRCAAFETSFFPDAYYGIAASTGAAVVCFSLALFVLARRNLGS